jgi:hypothetical protein
MAGTRRRKNQPSALVANRSFNFTAVSISRFNKLDRTNTIPSSQDSMIGVSPLADALFCDEMNGIVIEKCGWHSTIDESKIKQLLQKSNLFWLCPWNKIRNGRLTEKRWKRHLTI